MMTDTALHELALRLEARLCAMSGFARHMLSTPRLVAHLRARALERGLHDSRALEELFTHDRAEFAQIEQLFSPAETWLFRYPASFAYLRERCVSWRRMRPLRVVSLGAGGWSEPVSIAATLLDACEQTAGMTPTATPTPWLEVLAVDRNQALFDADPVFESLHVRGGVPSWAARQVLWTSHDGLDRAQPTRAVQDIVRTDIADIASWVMREAHRETRYQAIFFRNVAIYMDDPRRNRLFRSVADLIADDGLLFVGHAEVEMAMRATGFEVVDSSGVFALQRKAADVLPREESAALERRVRKEVVREREPLSSGAERDTVDVASDPQATLLDPVAHIGQALEHEARAEFELAEKAATRALYLDRRSEEALIIAARLAERRGAAHEAQRYRMRALQAHLDRQIAADDASNQEKG